MGLGGGRRRYTFGGHVGIVSGSCWDYFGIICFIVLGLFYDSVWNKFRIVLESFWDLEKTQRVSRNAAKYCKMIVNLCKHSIFQTKIKQTPHPSLPRIKNWGVPGDIRVHRDKLLINRPSGRYVTLIPPYGYTPIPTYGLAV